MASQRQMLALAAVAGALYLLRKPIASVTTSEGFDLSPYGGPTTYPQPIKTFADAIARQEGFYIAGSIPQRANNPGDLKLGAPTLGTSGITVFASADAGWNALYRQLWSIVTGASGRYNLDMSIADMARTWTATQQSAWSRNVADYLGVDPSTKLWEVLA